MTDQPARPARKIRLDQLLVDRGLAASKTQAQAAILAGRVRVGGALADKAGTQYTARQAEQLVIDVEASHPYVSRGGLKLEKALERFGVSCQDRVCLDAGASTGGFTDCLLQNGASRVYAVDVGYGQLDWKLRQDARVICLEKTNLRHLGPGQVPEPVSLISIDVSFISIKKILPALLALAAPQADLLALIKPQFERLDYLPDDGAFDGVVRGRDAHRQILAGVLADVADAHPELTLTGLDFSPITGPKGNIEFLAHWRRGQRQAAEPSDPFSCASSSLDAQVEAVLQAAYGAFHPGLDDTKP